ncbi:chromosome segregation protein SMC [PVC group bacterium (ex Bugula neritina AB1)]|nr:chromosome segregation protein SMC [PVC group bacterium (ex Bugula neritina AB1)]
MFLKKLEILGFKSFPEKTVFIFNQSGITAIVGPNGCGKSNVSDAIKWVVGEQNVKALRGAQMLDVIFKGSEAAPPLGMAKVSLTLDNTERNFALNVDEIVITRKLYRSGESSYQINDKNCRLKDISEFFMGTGLGVRSYSIIEQGQIDRMLISRPEERRLFFEEASGITKYKIKRKEALDKVNKTSEHLTRLNDILTEVTDQKVKMDRQVQQAKEYQKKFLELKCLDIKVQRDNIKEIDKKLKESESFIEEKIQVEEEIKKSLIQVENKVQQFHEAIDLSDINMNNQRKKWQVALSDSKNTENQVNLFEKDLNNLVLDKKKCLEQIKNSECHLQNFSEQRDAEKSSLLSCSQKIQDIETEIEKSKSEVDQKRVIFEAAKEDLDKNYQSILKAKMELSYNKDKFQSVQKRWREDSLKKDFLLKKKNDQIKNSKDLMHKMEDLEKHMKRELLQVDQMEVLNEKLQEEELQLSESLTQQMENLSQYQSKLSVCKSQLDMLESMQRNYEGYSEKTKKVLKRKDLGKKGYNKIEGDLSSFLKIKEPTYKIAIDSVLGSYQESLILPSFKDMLFILDEMKDNETGRLSFLSLDFFKRYKVSKEQDEMYSLIKPSAGFLTRAIEVVSFDQRYQGIMQSFLEKIFIFTKKEEAVQAFDMLVKNISSFISFVSLDGTIIDHRGSVIAASNIPASASLIGRNQEIKHLKEKVDHLTKCFKDSEKSHYQVKNNWKKVKEESRLKRKDLLSMNNRVNSLRQDMSNYQSKHEQCLMYQKESEQSLNNIRERKKSQIKLFRESRISSREMKEKLLFLEEKWQESKDNINNMKSIQKTLEEKHTSLKVNLASFKQKEKDSIRHIHSLEKRCQEETSSKERKKDYLKGFDTKHEFLLKQINVTKENSLSLLKNCDSLEGSMDTLKKERDELREALTKEEQKLRDASEKSIKCESLLKDKEMMRVALERKSNDIKERILDTYDMTWEEALSFDIGEDKSMALESKRLPFLKKAIKKISPVSPDIISEFEKIEEREKFLISQVEDLVSSKDSLLKIIMEANKESRKKLKVFFIEINKHFQSLFQELFGGGSSQIKFVDEENILESQIEILASLPGKKMQSISLMSGGEKTLTAMALLLAIFKMNPSPFCVLDEVDAPLDESNLDRLIKVMDSFKRKTQFIIITHNKKTMAKTDFIYGVTMQKRGISQSVSIKMIDSTNNLLTKVMDS